MDEQQGITNENLNDAIKYLQAKLDTALIAINLNQMTLALTLEKIKTAEIILNTETLSTAEKLSKITAEITKRIEAMDAETAPETSG